MRNTRRWGWDGLRHYFRYRGQSGQWAQLFHRLTGLGIAGFLLLHILDTSLIGFGREVYDNFTQIYHNPVVRFLEIVLVGAVVFHSVNGLRVIMIDFSDRATLRQKELFLAALAVFVILTVPAGVYMMYTLFQH